jgi:diphthamide synthase (EF-2-diphthine--ammonia ligase)
MCVPSLEKRYKRIDERISRTRIQGITVCVNGALLDESFVGKIVDSEFIARLPDGIDVCGENGEFHTFCFDGPIFSHPIKFSVAEVIQREYREGETTHRFWFRDLLPE